jgi:glycosyltransferase A (GT-A) superfamily protein (DUF2064 family)
MVKAKRPYRRKARRPRHVIVFARTPEYGRVKTRLAREIGSLEAWRFYRNATARLLRRLEADPTWTMWLALTGRPRPGWPGCRRWLPQGRGTLARRMEHCLRTLPPGDVVLLGSDIPGVTPVHIRRAFDAFARAKTVFAPAKDGGFWLVGARRVPVLPKPLFSADVRWSTPDTLDDVLDGMRVPYVLTDCLSDVDTAKDLARAQAEGRV